MLLSSHLYSAYTLRRSFHPHNEGIYYLCSVLPDIRYPAAIKRTKTHVKLHTLSKCLKIGSDAYKGYALHLLIDTTMGPWGFYEKLRSSYPLILRPFLRKSVINILVELYCLEKLFPLLPLPISKIYDRRYLQFGITKLTFDEFVSNVEKALDTGTIEGMMNIVLSSEKLKTNRKVKKYLILARIVLQNQMICSYLTARVENVYDCFLKELV